jgi:ParB family chromosome partitioning protein
MAKRPKSTAASRLGRGLSSLIARSAPTDEEEAAPSASAAAGPQAPPAEPRGPVRAAPLEIPTDQIGPNPHQPRRRFDPGALAELAASVAQQGILQPLLVARAGDAEAETPYVLIAGERRLRAARQAGLQTVPCVLRSATPQQMLEWSLVENIQREDLNPIERARAYRDYMDRFGLTQAQVAERTGDARPTVANHLRLLDLCDEVRAMLLEEKLAFGHARALGALAGKADRQRELAEQIARQGLSVRQAEQLVAAAVHAGEGRRAPGRRTPRAKPAYVRDMEARLTRAVGTRVQIMPGRRPDRGRVVVEYYSLDDFERIAAALGVEGDG